MKSSADFIVRPIYTRYIKRDRGAAVRRVYATDMQPAIHVIRG